jgi:hypothetical protein
MNLSQAKSTDTGKGKSIPTRINITSHEINPFTPEELADKLILHEEAMREGTPDPTNLKKNRQLLRELGKARIEETAYVDRGEKSLPTIRKEASKGTLEAWELDSTERAKEALIADSAAAK